MSGEATGRDVPPADGPVVSAPRSLDPRVRVVWLAEAIGATLVAAAALVTVGVVAAAAGAVRTATAAATPAAWWTLAVIGVAGALAAAVGYAVRRHRTWRYELRDRSLYLERGVITRVRTVVPYARIQHVDASRGPLERALGLSSTAVYTAGSGQADVTIPGLRPERAEALQGRLQRLATAAASDEPV